MNCLTKPATDAYEKDTHHLKRAEMPPCRFDIRTPAANAFYLLKYFTAENTEKTPG